MVTFFKKTANLNLYISCFTMYSIIQITWAFVLLFRVQIYFPILFTNQRKLDKIGIIYFNLDTGTSAIRRLILNPLGWGEFCVVLVPPKYEIIIVPSYNSFFQYCDSNIGLFSISPCRVITLNLLCLIYGISSLLFFIDCSL